MWKNTWSYTFTPPIRLHGMVLLLPTSLCLPFHFCDLCVWNFITMASSYPFAAFYGAKRPTVEEHHTVFWDRSLHLSKFGGGVVLQPPPLPLPTSIMCQPCTNTGRVDNSSGIYCLGYIQLQKSVQHRSINQSCTRVPGDRLQCSDGERMGGYLIFCAANNDYEMGSSGFHLQNIPNTYEIS